MKILDPEQYSDAASGAKVAESELKETLEGLAEHLFGKGIEVLHTSALRPSNTLMLTLALPLSMLIVLA